MNTEFRLLMIGAMYENGGNTTQRLLDGHHQLYVYPFESQLGTRLVQDVLTSLFPVKYRWPVFDLDCSPFADYKAIIDEECKVRARTAHVSKFRDIPFDFSDDTRCEIYLDYIRQKGKSRPNNILSFFIATFDAWKDYKRTGEEQVYVGYSPILAVDAREGPLRLSGSALFTCSKESMVRLRGYEKKAGSAVPRKLYDGLDTQSILRTRCCQEKS